MGKQKFCCKGVLRTTGQRASVMVSADNKEAAVQIAKKHGLQVESVIPVADAAASPPRPVAARPPQPPPGVKELGDRIDDILSSEDEEAGGGLDDLAMDDELGGAPTSPDSPSTKACPYCGEQILAVAVKCKHCGSYVGEKRGKAGEPSDVASSPSVPTKVWVIVGGVLAAAVALPIVGVVVWVMSRQQAAQVVPSTLPEPFATAPAPSPVFPAPPAPYKPSPEEMAFAAKLTAFLDSCDELSRLLEKVPKLDQYNKQCEAIKLRGREIPAPPQGSSWAGEAAASSKQFVDVTLGVLTVELTQLDLALEALHQSAGDSPEIRDAYRKVAEEVRKPTAQTRGLIPAACLAKAK